MGSSKKTLITIVGPTAIGKTSLSILIASYFDTEIISCDSRQFYKEMTLGTAVPEKEELAAVPHHFIQNRSIFEDYDVGAFERDALNVLDTLFKKHNTVVMVGGSGLYVKAVLEGLDDFPKIDSSIRLGLKHILETEGINSLQDQLKKLDVTTYNTIDIENPQRVIRALEICIGTNQPYSSYTGKLKKKRKFNSIIIGLSGEREKIYERINRRVDLMVEKGLLDEAQKLYPNKELNALQTVGYKELFSFFEEQITKDEAIQEIKKNTRRFAKRQLTWFKKDPNTYWFDFEIDKSKILKKIEDLI
ncbi:tRNA (adenosine(37)-N6)-dimethylallyltransferase MiaA [Flavobacteriaceae bacterium]|nr:tRNA (adenosine(37)-N6)-dimethylallyltransferase MiaA [Flavobacteriaceae bacterium]